MLNKNKQYRVSAGINGNDPLVAGNVLIEMRYQLKIDTFLVQVLGAVISCLHSCGSGAVGFSNLA